MYGVQQHQQQQQEQQQHPQQVQNPPHQSFMEITRQQERQDGVRFTWNCWPNSRQEAARMIAPFGVFLTPMKPRPDMPQFNYEPVYCSKCRGVLNPFCQADLRAKSWVCCFCAQRNGFPPHYSAMTEQQRPAELMAHFTTMEYILTRPNMPPIILFVVDTCVEADDMQALKDSLMQAVDVLPPSVLVGLVTFGRTVAVHDLSMELIKHSFVFRGTKDMTGKELQDQLGIGRYSGSLQQAPVPAGPHSASTKFPNKFIQPVQTCKNHMSESIKNILCDPWPTMSGKRPLRSTGAALNIAVGLLESSFPGTGARIMLFVGGPCTQGPGMVVGEDLKTPIRSYLDIAKDNAPYVRKATKFYSDLAHRAVSNSHSIDIFSCALDQTGLHEMKACCNLTGGEMLLGDNFSSELFSQNMQLFFNLDASSNLTMAFSASTEVKASRNVKVCGCLGLSSPLSVKTDVVSDVDMMGTGGTAEWKCCTLFPNSTLCFFFETADQVNSSPSDNQLHIQFITSFQHASGQKRVRVTTVSRSWVDPNNSLISSGFDQEATAVMLARLAVTRSDSDGGGDVQRWLDRTLIRMCNRFGQFNKDEPNSFSLPDFFAQLPTIIFHLRRSQLLQISNTSPDESAYYRHCLMKQDVTSCLIMIQPVLYAYSLQGPPTPVSLDSSSLQPDRILLLDTFFHIVIYRGETFIQWVNAGYDKMPEYANLANLLNAPIEDAQVILSSRFPMPRYVLTEQGGSQARFLLSKVNPSQTQSSAAYGWPGQENTTPVLTDDVNLQIFMEHLKKLAVSSSLN